MNHHPGSRSIALVFSYGLSYCRRVLRGIKAFAGAREDWTFVTVSPEAGAVRAIGRLRPDGVIAHVLSREIAEALGRIARPTVNVSGVFLDLPFPRVGLDNRAVGRQAARHLIDRGLRAFAVVGNAHHGYAAEREAGFRAAIAEAAPPACPVLAYHTVAASRLDPMGTLCPPDQKLRACLRSLPKPVGVFACNDVWGLRLAEVCRELGLRVPEDVAIVGVDNDDLLCELARPSLSSVAVPAERVGHEAAALLEKLIGGDVHATNGDGLPVLLPPLGVVARQSSDLLAIDDADLAAAVRFIRANSARPIRVEDVLDEVPVSRRALERRFREALRRSPFEEIRRCHLERARALLATTDLPMPAVAARSGFSTAKQLSTVFHQEAGETPTAYRRRFRVGPPQVAKPSPVGLTQ